MMTLPDPTLFFSHAAGPLIQNTVLKAAMDAGDHTWKKGETDKPHSHPLPFVVYAPDDCVLRVHNPDGTSRELKSKAGTALAGPLTSSHTADNPGETDCHAIFVERK